MTKVAKEFRGFVLLLAGGLAGCATAPTSPGGAPADTREPAQATSYPSPEARASLPAQRAATVELQADAPERYVVRKGDTLWDISRRFLKKPWHWPEIWHVNPSVKNPHRIYPGDVLSIYYVDGKPRLGIERGGVKLKPEIRYESLAEEDYGVPIQAVRPFLIRPQIVSEEELKTAAHVLDSQDRRLIYGTGDRIYIHSLPNPERGARYSIFRPGRVLHDPVTNEPLGYEAVYAGDAEIIREGEPATVELTETVREVMRGDRMLPLDPGATEIYFTPHAPPPGLSGRVISLFDALSQSALYQVVAINLGTRNGIEPGHVLAVSQAGRIVDDPYHGRGRPIQVELPAEQSGLLMVFRSFEKISYGLIMESERSMRVGDIVDAP